MPKELEAKLKRQAKKKVLEKKEQVLMFMEQ